MFIAKKNSSESSGEIPRESQHWRCPTPHQPLAATIQLPGSKSLTNRELVLAALADAPSIIRGALRSRDSELMLAGLEKLGADISWHHTAGQTVPELHITPPTKLQGSTSINCGLAGTVMRFLPAVATLATGPVAFDGDPYARKRPMRPVLTALRELGADISDDERGALPFTVHGTGKLTGGKVTIDASASSQFVSALLLTGARFTHGVHVVHTGNTPPSLPHIEMTLDVLRKRGINAYSPAAGEWLVEPGTIAATTVEIEPDLSNAAPFLAAALVCGGTVSIPNWPTHTTQVGAQLQHLLTVFGAQAQLQNNTLTVHGNGKIQGVQLHIPEAGELAPTLIGLAALAETPSMITGIGHIRHHETDRISALVNEINRLGGSAAELPDGISITPAPLHGGVWQCYADHRMATTGALIGLRVPGVQLDNVQCTTKTLPEFTKLWQTMLQPITAQNDLQTLLKTVIPGVSR